MAQTHPAPPLDPVAGAAWRSVHKDLLGGRPVRLDERSLDAMRAMGSDNQATLLKGRTFTERALTAPGPAGPVELAVFTPEGHPGTGPGIFWIHGGGMVVGNRWDAGTALDLAQPVGGVVVSVEYRLAPEHPAPAPVEDCLAALAWVADHAAELGIDPARLLLAGASAGGGIAAATALRCRDDEGPVAAGLLLCCPMLDDRMVSVSSGQFGEDLLWTRVSNEFGWRSLLGDRAGTDAVSVYEAPGRATDLHGLPPTYLDVGSADLFRDEDVAFASTIWACGGVAELHVWPGGYHGYEGIAPAAPLAIEACGVRERWVARLLGAAPGDEPKR